MVPRTHICCRLGNFLSFRAGAEPWFPYNLIRRNLMQTFLRKSLIVSGLALGAIVLGQNASADQGDREQSVPPIVFQVAGPTAASIQSTVDAFRAELGATNNGNTAGPLTSGHREINWDG